MKNGLTTFLCLLLVLVSANSHADEPTGVTETFETLPRGPFTELSTGIGRWSTLSGIAAIDPTHAKSGKQCLWIQGGEQTVVELELSDEVDRTGDLRFWAERWTSRGPFEFRIEKETNDGWVEIFNGDQTVRVGREFLNHVRVPLRDESIRRLRIRCASPNETGVLIDDLRIAPLVPQRLVGITVEPSTWPVLIGQPRNSLLQLRIETSGQLEPLSISGITFRLPEHTADDLESLKLFQGTQDSLDSAELVAEIDSTTINGRDLRLDLSRTPLSLDEGVSFLWLSAEPKPQANIDEKLVTVCESIQFTDGERHDPSGQTSVQRLGIALRRGGDDGVHTYRIPGLATTNAGTLIGVYDVRYRGGGDLPGDIDIGMSRSTDGGRTWEPMKIIMDLGSDPRHRFDGVGDPAVLVDRETGTIWVAGLWSHGNRGWHGSGPGTSPDETGQLLLVRSDDDGVTWSQPINITEQIKRPEWCLLLQGPGKGITMRDGTLVFAGQFQDSTDNQRLPRSTIIFSKDHGLNWEIGTGAFDDTTEAQVVEIEPGVLMLNCRYNRASTRVVMVTRDLGRTWERHPSSERELIEPRACMASLIDVDGELGQDRGNWLLFSNPNSTAARNHITIKASRDLGTSWPESRQLLLDQGTGGGYSCMTMIDRETVGILYEGSRSHLTFQRVPLVDLIGGE